MADMFDLQDRLFRELDRLEAAEGDAILPEIERAKAISQMAGRVIDNANTAMRAAQLQHDLLDDPAAGAAVPRLLFGEQPASAEAGRP